MVTPRPDALTVWMNGEHVGLWRAPTDRPQTFAYAPEWFGRTGTRPISHSLPMLTPGHVHEGEVVANFFDNLLPDRDDFRRILQRRWSADSDQAFDLLTRIGRDCIGAIQLAPDGEQPPDVRTIDAEPLDDAEIARMLRATASAGFGAGSDDIRLSLAGAQEKTALLWHGGRWMRPLGSTPTTHILKRPMGQVGDVGADFSASIDIEHLCACLLDELGMPIAPTRIAQFEDERALVVERFDRRLAADGRWIVRIPQEDACQALGVSRHRKYESDGGPGLQAIVRLLDNARSPAQDQVSFLQAQLLFWLLAAIDGHAKNFSLFIEAGGAYRLTPLYDVISAYPIVGRGPRQLDPKRLRLAMAVLGKNRHYTLDGILPRHWRHTASMLRVPFDADAFVAQLQTQVPAALERVAKRLPQGFPEHVRDSVFDGFTAALNLWTMASGAD